MTSTEDRNKILDIIKNTMITHYDEEQANIASLEVNHLYLLHKAVFDRDQEFRNELELFHRYCRNS